MTLLPADLRGIRFFVKHSYPGPPDTVRPKPLTISFKEANSNPAQSSIQRQLLSLGLPAALNHASLALMQLVDAWLAGKMGSVHLAAITPAGLLVAAWAVLGSEMLSSVTTLGSQSIGQGHPGAAVPGLGQPHVRDRLLVRALDELDRRPRSHRHRHHRR